MQAQSLTENQQQNVRRYLETGKHETLVDWANDWVNSAKRAEQAMKRALVLEVREHAQGFTQPKAFDIDHIAFTRAKVAPMVNGFFQKSERANVLAMLEKSVVFLVSENIEQVLNDTSLDTAWTLANMYLFSIAAKPLGKNARPLVGLSEETTCYVSHLYLHEEEKFADFVVHEAAHVFHNSKRFTVGLPETRSKEFLLNIDFRQRETFAYACEVYSKIVELSKTSADRLRLCKEAIDTFSPPDEDADVEKFHNALLAASASRNGWKRILEVCAPSKKEGI